MASSSNKYKYPELADALKCVREYFVYAGLFSAAINILLLTPVIYMLTVFDRVVSSGSLSTLAMLTLLMVGLLFSMGGFEWVRSRILISASNKLEETLRPRVTEAAFQQALFSGGAVRNAQPVSDLISLRQFLTGQGLFAFFDAPWFPVYVVVMFLFHTWFGVAAIFAGIVMVVLAFVNEKTTSEKLQEANLEAARASGTLAASLRNVEAIAAMGMADDIRKRHEHHSSQSLELQTDASKWGGVLASLSKTFRLVMQSLLLGLGAFLALRQEISPGMMVAGSLLLGRALAPIDMLVGSWKQFSIAKAQYERLGSLLLHTPPSPETMSLPAPRGKLEASQLVVAPPGSNLVVIKGVSLALEAGESLGIVGPSASGKSTLARALLGIWPVRNGTVRLDGADISAYDRTRLGPYIGYLPQDIELFDGSIADNICRFGEADADKIVAAARLSGVHELVLHLPEGYDTIIGAGGGTLSGGQRQRIGLARAVYGEPRLLVLDEPNSNLDEQGEKELRAALGRIKEGGATLVVITHRTNLLQEVDKILVLKEGLAAAFGPRDQVLAGLMGKPVPKQLAAN